MTVEQNNYLSQILLTFAIIMYDINLERHKKLL